MKTILYMTGIVCLLFLSSCATKVKTKPSNNNVTVVKVAPRGYKVVYIKGKKYYTWNGNRKKKKKRGYIVIR